MRSAARELDKTKGRCFSARGKSAHVVLKELVTMFEIVAVVIFLWLLFKALGLVFRLTWSVTKLVAGLLMALAFPLLVVCLIFAWGLMLIVPLVLIGIALAILKRSI